MADHQGGTTQLHSPSTEDSTFSDLGLRAEGQSGVSRHGPRQEAGGHKVRSAGGAEHLSLQKVEPFTSGPGNDHHRCPSTAREVISLLEEIIVLSTEESALINYHPTKKLLPDMTGPAVTFSLVLGLRDSKAYRLWTVIETLAGNAALMLVATTLRKERRSRSQLAQAVAQELRRGCLVST